MQEMDENGAPIPSIQPEMYVGVITLSLGLTTVCVGLRFYVRAIMIKAFGRDDWVLLAAYLVYCAHACLLVAYAFNIMSNGLVSGYLTSFKASHSMLLVPCIGSNRSQILVFQGWMYTVDQVLIKAALAAFFLRVLPQKSWQRKVIVVSFVLFALFTTTFGFLALFQCGDPLDLTNTDRTCLSIPALMKMSYTSAAFNTFMDWLLTLMPITVIYKARMSRRTKWSVVFIMMLGAFASIISIIRIPFIDLGVVGPYDTFTKVTPFIMLALWENCVGIMAVSLAALRPLVRKVFKDDTHGSDAAHRATSSRMGISSATRGLTPTGQKRAILIATSYSIEDEGAHKEQDVRSGWP